MPSFFKIQLLYFLSNIINQDFFSKVNMLFIYFNFFSEGRLCNLNLEQLDEVEDDEDEEIIRMFRDKRIAELKALEAKNKFGEVGIILIGKL